MLSHHLPCLFFELYKGFHETNISFFEKFGVAVVELPQDYKYHGKFDDARFFRDVC